MICRMCRQDHDRLTNGLCPQCLKDEETKARVKGGDVEMTLWGIIKRSGDIATTMADAFHAAATKALFDGSAYGWPK